MVARVAPGQVQQLHHFVSISLWPSEGLERVLPGQAVRLVGGPDAVLVVDDTAPVKQGRHSVGVQRQYCGQPCPRAGRATHGGARAGVPPEVAFWSWSYTAVQGLLKKPLASDSLVRATARAGSGC